MTTTIVPGLVGLLALPATPAAADPPGTKILPVPAATWAVTLGLGPGRAYITEWNNVSPVRPYDRYPVSKSGNTLTVGGRTELGYLEGSEGRLSVSSNRLLADPNVLRYEGSSDSTAVGPNSTRIVRLSGNRALFVQKVGNKEWPALRNIKTGAVTTPFGTGVDRKYPTDLWGEYFIYALPDGSVHRRDLRTGTTVKVRNAGSRIQTVGVYAGRIAYLTACPLIGTCKQSLVYRTVGGSSASVLGVHDVRGFRLGGGSVVFDTTAGAPPVTPIVRAHLFDGTSQQVGILTETDDIPSTYDLYDETVAWIDSGNDAKVAPLPAHKESPRYLGNAIAPASFHPPNLWRGAFPLSKPLLDCKVTFRKNGTPVRIIGCANTTKTGLATIAWDGKTGSGKPVSKGTYTWTLTGSDTDGKLLWYNGSGSAITGTLTVN